jgi:hypothetical protein
VSPRWLAAVGCWLLLAMLSLALLAGLRIDMPAFPQSALVFDRAQLTAADAGERDGVLRIRGADANGLTLVMQPVDAVDAARYRYLTLELDDVPGVLRAMAIWRIDGAFHAMPLPGGFRAGTTVDLHQSPAWQGTLESVGFALLPTDYLATVATLERDFVFVGGRLESDSWRGALRSLRTQWRAYRPWNGR